MARVLSRVECQKIDEIEKCLLSSIKEVVKKEAVKTGFDVSIEGEQIWPPRMIKIVKVDFSKKTEEEIEKYETNMEQKISGPSNK